MDPKFQDRRTQPDGYYTQSAVIPHRLRDGELELLLVTTRKGKRWVLPKGVVEPDLSAADSAAKEAIASPVFASKALVHQGV